VSSETTRRRRQLTGTVVKLALFTAVSVVLSVVVVASLLDLDVSPATSYRAAFSDASTIQSGDPVRIAGVKVGRVTGVHVVGAHAVVSFKVDDSQEVTTTTDADIHYENLLGQRFLDLVAGRPGAPRLRPGATIPESRTAPALDLSDLFDGFQPLFEALTPNEVNALSANIISTFQGESTNVAGLVTETAALTNNLADRGQVIDSVVDNLTGLTRLVATHDTQLGQLIDSFDTLADDLAGERGQIGSAITSASQLTSNLSNLLGATQAPFEQAVSGLTSVTATLNANQGTIDAFLDGLPGLVGGLDKTLDSGAYLKLYACNDTILANHGSPLSPVALPSPVMGLLELSLPQGVVGDQSQHTATCA
jgi:phospholipid/cholesterol/gamma-HCH transport system substrate-binding protein